MQEQSAASVAIVGAGLSGLIAARELQRRGVDFLVLESADRTGGRTMCETTSLASRVDLGGQWIGHNHHRIAALAAELGATPFPMHNGGAPTLINNERRVALLGRAIAPALVALVGLDVFARLPTPRRWQNRAVASVLEKLPGTTARRLLQTLADVSWTADLNRLTVKSW